MIMTKGTAAGGLLRVKIEMDFFASRSTRFLDVSKRVTRQSLVLIIQAYRRGRDGNLPMICELIPRITIILCMYFVQIPAYPVRYMWTVSMMISVSLRYWLHSVKHNKAENDCYAKTSGIVIWF